VTRALVASLPEQLWIERIELTGVAGAAGRQNRPAVVVELAGKALNGVEVGQVVQDFHQKLLRDPGMAGFKPEMKAGNNPDRVVLTVDLVGGT
jgi:hypothetical protein